MRSSAPAVDPVQRLPGHPGLRHVALAAGPQRPQAHSAPHKGLAALPACVRVEAVVRVWASVTHVLKSEDKDSRWGGEALPSLKYIYRSIYIGFMKIDCILSILHICNIY